MAKRYLIWLYFRHFIVMLASLELFFLLIDYLQSQKELPPSANLIVLYLYFQSIAALKITLPLSIVFGALSSFVYLVRSNEGVALMSSGYTRAQMIKPFFYLGLLISILFIALNATKIGYFYENAQSILRKDRSNMTANLFFKFNDNYIYIEKINPITGQAANLKFFVLQNGSVSQISRADIAVFDRDGWTLKNVTVTKIPNVSKISNDGSTVTLTPSVRTLQGFKPKVIDSVSNSNASLNIIDMLEALIVLKNQDINVEHIRQLLFSTIFIPLLAPIVVVLIFTKLPMSARLGSIGLFTSNAIFSVLLGFGLLMAISKAKFEKFSLSLALFLIFITLATLAYRQYKKELL
jgi:lipopolysaccharide export system permease protein